MSDEIEKSNYGPRNMKLYNPTDNVRRKASNTGDTVEGNGRNQNVKAYSPSGFGSAKQQAAREMTQANIRARSGPVKTLSPDEIARLKDTYAPPKMKKDEEIVDKEADGKQEVVEGKETLKKDPKKRWAELKKALDHKKAFITLEDEMGANEDEQPQEEPEAGRGDQAPGVAVSGEQDPQQQQEGGEAPPQDGAPDQEQLQPDEEPAPEEPQEEAPPEGEDEPAPEGDEAPEQPEEGEEEQPDENNGDLSPDQQELIDALKEEGYSDQEIAYVVHGHHAAEVDPSKQAKAQATQAMSDLDLQNASKMADIEHDHAKRTMDHEHEHKRRMADLEYQNAQKKGNIADLDEKHRQRMLDLEYENAQKTKQMELDQNLQQKQMERDQAKAGAPDAEADKATKRELAQVEIAKKKLELKIREEEMKLELEFKKREHELKLKMMEQQLKEQAKQKQEISGIKHQQRVVEAKNPEPKPKKALKKSEEPEECEACHKPQDECKCVKKGWNPAAGQTQPGTDVNVPAEPVQMSEEEEDES